MPANRARIQFLSDLASDLSPCVRRPQSLSAGRRFGSLLRTRTRPRGSFFKATIQSGGHRSSSSASGTAHKAKAPPSIPKVSGASRARSGLIVRQSCSTNQGRSIRKSVSSPNESPHCHLSHPGTRARSRGGGRLGSHSNPHSACTAPQVTFAHLGAKGRWRIGT
jgi:hypothetical protein